MTEILLRFAPHLRGTRRSDVAPDVLAGLTVAALAVPQGLAFALLAGLPVEMGLLAAALPAVVAALFGSSPYLVTGPTSPTALVIGASVVAPALATGALDAVEAVRTTSLLAGLFLLGFVGIGIGRASRFLSDSVIVGFATGAGLLIALMIVPQLAPELPTPAASPDFAPRAWGQVQRAIQALTATDAHHLVLALATAACVRVVRRLDPRLPAAFIALVLASWASWAIGSPVVPLSDLGALGWPSLQRPSFAGLEGLAGPALAVAVLVTLQSIAAARATRPPAGAHLDPGRELVAQGLANMAAAFTGAMPACGSISRTAVARSAGARSRLSALASGVFVAALLPVIGPLLQKVPAAAVVGLVVLSGVELIDLPAIRRAATTRGDALILAVTLAATLWIDVAQALFLGVFLSLALLVRRAGRLQMVELVQAPGGRFREIALDARTGTTPAVILHLEGDLNFAVAVELGERLEEITARGARVLILRLKRARHLDATLLEALRAALVDARERGVRVLVCGLSEELVALLATGEIGRLLGADGLLRAGPRLFEGFERALDRTRDWLSPLSDAEIFRSESLAPGLYDL